MYSIENDEGLFKHLLKFKNLPSLFQNNRLFEVKFNNYCNNKAIALCEDLAETLSISYPPSFLGSVVDVFSFPKINKWALVACLE